MIIIESDAITKSFSTICLLNIMTRWRLLLLCTTVSFQIFSEIEHCTQISADRKWIDVMAISDNFINRQMIFFVCPLYQCHIQLHAPHHKERMLLCNWLRRSNSIFVILEISVMIRPSMLVLLVFSETFVLKVRFSTLRQNSIFVSGTSDTLRSRTLRHWAEALMLLNSEI